MSIRQPHDRLGSSSALKSLIDEIKDGESSFRSNQSSAKKTPAVNSSCLIMQNDLNELQQKIKGLETKLREDRRPRAKKVLNNDLSFEQEETKMIFSNSIDESFERRGTGNFNLESAKKKTCLDSSINRTTKRTRKISADARMSRKDLLRQSVNSIRSMRSNASKTSLSRLPKRGSEAKLVSSS
jgi:hypothetical protein